MTSQAVADYEVTCFACPTQIVGALQDGRRFYFRYRWGLATLQMSSPSGDDIEGACAGERLGSELDGFLTEGEALELIEKLARSVPMRTVTDGIAGAR